MKKLLILLIVLSQIPGCDSSPVSPMGGVTVRIQYDVPTDAHVRLWIVNSYDVSMGTYVDSTLAAGIYAVSFSAASFPDGIYFYVLEETPVGGGAPTETHRQMLFFRRR